MSFRYLFFLSAILYLTSCASTGGQISEVTPAEYCDDHECLPNVTTLNKTFGPIALSGGLNLSNLPAIASWGRRVETAINEAAEELDAEIEEHQCGPSCDKIVSGSLTLYIALNPGGMNTSSSTCQHAFNTTLQATGEGLTCDLAALSAMRSINNAIKDAGRECQNIAPECGAESVSANITERNNPFNVEADESTFWCKTTITADLTVRCGEGTTSISSPEASGEWKADIECKQAEQCLLTTEEAFPGQL